MAPSIDLVPEYALDEIGPKQVTISLEPKLPTDAEAVRQRLILLLQSRDIINREIQRVTGRVRGAGESGVEYRCLKCGHGWQPRRVNQFRAPRACPKCQSRSWQKPRETSQPEPDLQEMLSPVAKPVVTPPIRPWQDAGVMAPPPRPSVLPMASSRTWRSPEPEPQPERLAKSTNPLNDITIQYLKEHPGVVEDYAFGRPPVPEPTTPPSLEPQEVPRGLQRSDAEGADRTSDRGAAQVDAGVGVATGASVPLEAPPVVAAVLPDVTVPASSQGPLTQVEKMLSREDLMRLRQRRAEILKLAEEEDARGDRR